jgi:hypothetical protein
MIVGGIHQGVAVLFGVLLPVPILPEAIASIFSLYFLLVECRLLGLLYWTSSRELGWFDRGRG